MLVVHNFIKRNAVLTSSNSLLALSGGADSMVLADLLLKSGSNFSVAHCNFQLRGDESDEDENFVKNFCEQNHIRYFIKKFEVKKFKQSGNYSTQMAARELRYTWFEELVNEYKFDFLLTAHHLGDSFETFLINLLRGTGTKGLTGIKNQSNNLLRPLLNWSKAEILEYAVQNKVSWREDRSNLENDYVRNQIRNQISPILKEIQPEYLKNFSKTLIFLNDDCELLKKHIEFIRKKYFKKLGNDILIEIENLKKLDFQTTYFYHLFSTYGFNHPEEIIKLINSAKNGEITSNTHRLLKNRNELLLTVVKTDEKTCEIELNQDSVIQKPLYLKFVNSDHWEENADESFDYEKIKFPIRMRKPKQGDVFKPLGMANFKKLSKFFKDEKYSKLEKERAWVLVDKDDRIIYVVGKRMDDRFKITKHTQIFLNIYLC